MAQEFCPNYGLRPAGASQLYQKAPSDLDTLVLARPVGLGLTCADLLGRAKPVFDSHLRRPHLVINGLAFGTRALRLHERHRTSMAQGGTGGCRVRFIAGRGPIQ